LRLDDLVAILEDMPSIKVVINDGQLLDRQQFDRNMDNVPYIEVIERDIDFSEHSSDDRIRRVTAEGRIILFKHQDDIIKTILLEFENAIKKNAANQIHPSIEEPVSFTERLYRIDFEATYFESVDKVA